MHLHLFIITFSLLHLISGSRGISLESISFQRVLALSVSLIHHLCPQKGEFICFCLYVVAPHKHHTILCFSYTICHLYHLLNSSFFFSIFFLIKFMSNNAFKLLYEGTKIMNILTSSKKIFNISYPRNSKLFMSNQCIH